jgi:hypothetical protein
VSVALAIQHAKRMSCFILSSVACLAVKDFSTLSHKRHDFPEKYLSERENVCFAFFSATLV